MSIKPNWQIFSLLAALVAAFLFGEPASFASLSPAEQVAMRFAAIERGEFSAAAVVRTSPPLTFPNELFEPEYTSLRSRLKKGYAIIPMGQLKKRGQEITLWKITVKDGADDLLAELTMKDGEVTGFQIN